MTIIRNSAKCNTCDTELESVHRHDFRVHTCPNNPKTLRRWSKDSAGNDILIDVAGEITFNWGVDGGKSYLRRIGEGYTDTSECTEQEDI